MDHNDALPEASTGETVPSDLTTEMAPRRLVPISAHELLARRWSGPQFDRTGGATVRAWVEA